MGAAARHLDRTSCRQSKAAPGRQLISRLGGMPLEEIKPQMVIEAVRGMEKRDALDVAKRVLQDTNRILDYAVSIDRIE